MIQLFLSGLLVWGRKMPPYLWFHAADATFKSEKTIKPRCF